MVGSTRNEKGGEKNYAPAPNEPRTYLILRRKLVVGDVGFAGYLPRHIRSFSYLDAVYGKQSARDER